MDFRCFYCTEKFENLIATKQHLISTHPDQEFKFRQIIVNETTGKRVFVSKRFKTATTRAEHEAPTPTNETRKLTEKEDETPTPTSETRKPTEEEEDIFLQRWPQAAARLKDQGLLSDWITLHEIIADGNCL